MALSLTARQAEILEHIELFTAVNGYPPSSRELSDACGLGGPSGAHRMITTLERKGFLERTHGQSRGLVVTQPKVDRDTLAASDLVRLLTVAGLHALFSDLELTVAVGMKSTPTRETLILEALRRTRRIAALHDMLGEEIDEQPNVSDHLDPLSAVLMSPTTGRWQDFLVDQCLFNRLMTYFCDAVASQDPRRRAVLWPDISIGRAAAESGEIWLRAMLEQDPSLYSSCRERAYAVAKGAAEMTNSITDAYGEGELSVTLVALPESLLLPIED